jgi:hypothetical protein
MTRAQAGAPELAKAGVAEEMIQALVDQFDRTFSSLDHGEALNSVRRFLQGLDEPTLRALAYRQGIFEPEAGTGKPGDEEC